MPAATPTPKKIHAVIYCRVSSDDLRMGRSVGEQEQEARDRAKELGAHVTEVFVDNDRSASRFARREREQHRALLDHLRDGTANLLILWESSRGDRELERWAGLLNLCRANGVHVHVVTHHRTYDLSVPRDWRTLAEDGVDSAYEVEKHRDRILRAKRGAAHKGKPAGKLQFGYTREYDERGRLVAQVIREDQAEVIREAAARVRRGESCYSVAADFNRRGIRTPRFESLMRKVADNRQHAERGVELDPVTRQALLDEADQWEADANALRWDLTLVRRLVTNPAYVAQRIHQGKVVGPADWPAILDEQVWADCVARMSDPARRTHRDSAVKHLLSGAARCAECGALVRVGKSRGSPGYLCPDAFHIFVAQGPVEEFITAVVISRLSRPDVLDLLAPRQQQDSTRAAREEAAGLQARLDAFRDRAADGGISPEGLARIEARLIPQIESAQRRARVASVPVLVREVAGPDAARRWAGLSVGQRRELVMLLVDVRIGRTRRGARAFDPGRLGESRWVGDSRTWAEIWAESPR